MARKHGNVTVKDFRKYEKLKYKQNKLKLDIDFLNNCKRFDVYPNKFNWPELVARRCSAKKAF